MLKSLSESPTLKLIERAGMVQYGRLEAERSESRAKALIVARGPSRIPDSTATHVFHSQARHDVRTCRPYWIVRREPKENGSAKTATATAPEDLTAAAAAMATVTRDAEAAVRARPAGAVQRPTTTGRRQSVVNPIPARDHIGL